MVFLCVLGCVLLFGMRRVVRRVLMLMVMLLVQIDLVMLTRAVAHVNVVRQRGAVRSRVSMVTRMMPALRLHQARRKRRKRFFQDERPKGAMNGGVRGWKCVLIESTSGLYA